MEYLLAPILSFILLYKYAAVFAVVYFSAVIVPFPANAMLLAVGAFSSQGYFSFWISLVVAVTSNILGDCTDYALTRKYGAPIIHFLRIDRVRLFGYLKEELRTDAAITVFTTRFASSLSPIASLLAGLVGVPFGTFILYDFLGNFIEPFALLSVGYLVGNYWSSFSDIFGIFGAIAAVAVVLFILLRISGRMKKKYMSL
jgi:membrane protein DedA with SNARE-associated domain